MPRPLVLLVFGMFAVCFTSDKVNQLTAQDLPFQEKILPVLFNPKVQQELELSDKQILSLKKMLEGIKNSQQRFGKELKEFSQSGATKSEIAKKREEVIKELEVEKKDVQKDAFDQLLPHQIDRLKQLTVQVMMRESAKANKNQSGLLTEEMKAFLDIDKVQAKKIEDKSVELQKKLMAEIKELQEKYRLELLKELTPKQRTKFEKATGSTFTR